MFDIKQVFIICLFLLAIFLYVKTKKLKIKISQLELKNLVLEDENKYISWNYLTDDLSCLMPNYNEEVICYIPSWNQYKLCTINENEVWFDSEGELGPDNSPSKWMHQ